MLVNRSVLAEGLAAGSKLSDLIGRGVGKSTYAILTAMAKAGSNPGERFAVCDPDVKNMVIAMGTAHHAKALIERTGLQGYEVTINQPGGDPKPTVFISCNFAERLTA